MVPHHLASDAILALQFHRRQEVVEQLVQRALVQRVDERLHCGVVVAIVAKPKGHVRVILLLNVCLVVLAVGARSG